MRGGQCEVLAIAADSVGQYQYQASTVRELERAIRTEHQAIAALCPGLTPIDRWRRD